MKKTIEKLQLGTATLMFVWALMHFMGFHSAGYWFGIVFLTVPFAGFLFLFAIALVGIFI